ncbi:hypothetical protein [Sphingomonas sp. IBVSS2]|uniref:hypothetical protein n=1 Tax=Sphingomonas sp. IBVSS2 TaxID=1985172 RepID=UPI0011817FEC|nr:hypothetical protein [Sphingomonas sp. IBVSS2]
MRVLTEFEMALVAGGARSSEIIVKDPRDRDDRPPPDWNEVWDNDPPYDGGNYDNPDGAYPSGGGSPGSVAIAGGGPGVNGLIDSKHIKKLSPTGSVIQSNGYVLVDFNRDGIFDMAWQHISGKGWEMSADGKLWTPDRDPGGPAVFIANPPQ